MQERENFFQYNGGIYYTGTIVRMYCSDRFGHDIVKDAIFIWHITSTDKYVVQIGQCTYIYPRQHFYSMLVEVTGNMDLQSIQPAIMQWKQRNRPATITDELNIDGLFIAWVWYIFIMLIATIFYDRVGIWFFATVIFFNYRNKKLKEAGFKR